MSTEFHRLHGAVHSGTGPQVNVLQFLEQTKALVRRGAGPWSEAIFEDLAARFYPPEGFDEIRRAVENLRTVVLEGDPGSGRRYTALALLRKSEYSRGLFYAPNVGGEDEGPLADLRLESGDRVLVDLSTMNVDRFTSMIAPDIPPFFKRVHDEGARSVVILPDGCKPDPDWQKYVRRVFPPDPVKAYRQHLRSIDIQFEEDLDEAAIREYFRQAPMRDLSRLMDLVTHARTANPTRDYHDWTRVALEALRAGGEEVAAILKDLRAGQQRALLLSASLFAGGSADAASYAAKVLLDTLKYPPNPDHPLDQSDLQEQLANFGAGIDRLRRLQFRKPLDAAIRSYLWDGYPALRAALAKWIEVLVLGGQALGDHDVALLVRRFGEQHLRTGQVGPLRSLIARLGGAEKEQAAEQAFGLLKMGLEHAEHGRLFRRQMWEWSKDLPSAGLGEVLIRACAEVIAKTHPDQALVRLHHLARKPGRIGQSACGALVALFDQAHLRRLIRQLLQRMADFPNARDPHVFVRVIDPYTLTDRKNYAPRLTAEISVRTHLGQAWRATLHERPEGWQPQLDRWLGTVADTTTGRDVLLTILAEAPDDFETRSLLHSTALEWAATRGGAWKTVDILLKRINDAQGISFIPMERTDR